MMGLRPRLYRPETWDDCIVYCGEGRFLLPKGLRVEREAAAAVENAPGVWEIRYDPRVVFPDGTNIAFHNFVFDQPQTDFRRVTNTEPSGHFHWIKFPDIDLAQCSLEDVTGPPGYCPNWFEEEEQDL